VSCVVSCARMMRRAPMDSSTPITAGTFSRSTSVVHVSTATLHTSCLHSRLVHPRLQQPHLDHWRDQQADVEHLAFHFTNRPRHSIHADAEMLKQFVW